MDDKPTSSDTPGTSPNKIEHKTRRPHRKSRNGCTKCKERRVKCDELTPRCSRCQKTNLVCHYPKRQGLGFLTTDDYWMDPMDPSLLSFELPGISRRGDGASSPESSGSFYTFPDHYINQERRVDSPLRSHVAQTLAPADFELLRHYLEHTCKDMTVDQEDQYTIQIGVPNLACQSKPLMRSVLALAAICRCCDIIDQPSVTYEERGKVLEYLTLADQYHMQSLREIQMTFPDSKHYDHVLANAAMMGMYGSGSHRTRIWLTKTATLGEQALFDFMPKQLQWLSLWRAVDLAYMGILNDTSASSPDEQQHHKQQPQRGSSSSHQQPRSPPEFMPSGSMFQPQSQYEYKITSRLERSKGPAISHPVYSILAATAGSALTKLRETARKVARIHASNSSNGRLGTETLYRDPGGGTPPYSYSPDPALQSCFTALSVLTNVISDTFPCNDTTTASTASTTTTSSQLTFEVDINPSRAGRLSEVSPYMRRYAASITALTPTKLPRRMIPAFIHKAPTSYLKLVTEMISFIHTSELPPQPPAAMHRLHDSAGTPTTATSDFDLNLDPALNLNLDHDMDMDSMDMSMSPSMHWGAPTPPPPHSTAAHHSSSASFNMESHSPVLPSLAHQLALEIFAHWLVLMILVDTVWWIGDLGAWELGRIVNFRKTTLLREQQSTVGLETGVGNTNNRKGGVSSIWSNQRKERGQGKGGEEDDWWPESMYEVSRQFDKHRTKGGPSLGRDT